MKVNLKIAGVFKKRPFDIQHAINLLNIGNNGGWVPATKKDQEIIDRYLKNTSKEQEE